MVAVVGRVIMFLYNVNDKVIIIIRMVALHLHVAVVLQSFSCQYGAMP